MRKFVLSFLVGVSIFGGILLERSDVVRPLNHLVLKLLAKASHRELPSVTAVKMPFVQSRLQPQDVALAFRAIIGFQPHQIDVVEPIGDFFTGPFSLLREAMEQGELQGVPIHFLTSEASAYKSQSCNGNIPIVSLEDLLLKYEERERGNILPQLDALFSQQVVLIGGPQVAEQAMFFCYKAEKKLERNLPIGVEFFLLLILVLICIQLRQLSWLDFSLTLLGGIVGFIGIELWLFQAGKMIWPWCALFLVFVFSFFIKLLSCTARRKE